MARPNRTKKQTQTIEDDILAMRHAGTTVSAISRRLTNQGTPMSERSVITAYGRALARHFPPELFRDEVARALMVCDEQVFRSRQRLQQPHPKMAAQGPVMVVDDEGRPVPVPDLDIEVRIEAEISRVEERRARIAGTFAPAKHAVTVLTADDLRPLLEEWSTRLSPEELEEARRRAMAIEARVVDSVLADG
jgi:hypothetical protein